MLGCRLLGGIGIYMSPSDFCVQNIIMCESGVDASGAVSHRVAAFVDYEDFCYTPLINELAVTLGKSPPVYQLLSSRPLR